MPIKPRRRKDDQEPTTPFQDPAFRRSSIHFDDLEFQRRFEQNLIRYGLLSGTQVTEEINNSIIVSGGGTGGAGWCYWTKEGSNLVYYEGNVGVGIHPHSNDFHVKGNVLVAAADEQAYLEIRNWSDTARDPVLKWALGATPSVKFTMGVDDSEDDKWKISNLAYLGRQAASHGAYGDRVLFWNLQNMKFFAVPVSDFAGGVLAEHIAYSTSGGSGDGQVGTMYQFVWDELFLYYTDGAKVQKIDTSTGSFVSKCTVPRSLWGLTMWAGKLYAVAFVPTPVPYKIHVYRIDADSMALEMTTEITQGSNDPLKYSTPRGMCTDGANLFVCDYGGNQYIKKATMAGTPLIHAQVDSPISCEVDDNYVYVCQANQDVQVFSKVDLSFVGTITMPDKGGQNASPTAIAINTQYIYVHNSRSSSQTTVDKFDMSSWTFLEELNTSYAGYTSSLSYSLYITKYETVDEKDGDLVVIHHDGKFMDVWPKLRLMDDLRLLEADDEEGNYVGLKAPDTVAGSYTLTFPAAAPGAQSHISCSTAGVLSFGQDVRTVASPTWVRATLTQTTGTAPLTVSSTTVVTNLNADTVDGYHHNQSLLMTASPTFVALTLSQTTGTAPMTVASTTVVTNLNADLLDGKHEAAFVLIDGTRALTANWDAGSFKITAQTLESDVATGTAPLTIASTTLVSNLNADLLDGLHYTSFPQLVISATEAPTVDDDIDNYREGCLWIEQDANKCYICVENADGAAVWQEVGAGGGAGSFLDLSDTPADYDDVGGYFVKVKDDESGLEFIQSSVAGHALSSASHTDVDAGAPDDGDVLMYDDGSGKWVPGPLPAAAPHDLLSNTHSDTVVSAVSRGSLIYGDSTPKWAELAVGTNGQVLTTDGTDVYWDDPVGGGAASFVDLDDVPADYADDALKLVRVNSGETALEFIAQTTLKLDDFGTPDDNTDLDVSTSRHGLCPKAPAGTTKDQWLCGDGTWSYFRTLFGPKLKNRYYSGGFGSSGLTAAIFVADQIRGVPFIVTEACTFDRIGLGVTNGNGAGRFMRLGIYDTSYASGYPYPGNLIVDSGEIAVTSAIFHEVNINVTLTPGLYWLAYLNSYGFTIRLVSNSTCPIGYILGAPDGANGQDGWISAALAYGALPATFTAGATPNNAGDYYPNIVLRVA